MGSNYVSPEEQAYRDERKARAVEADAYIKEKNSKLIGEPKTYMGVTYQLRQDGLYVCTNLPNGCQLSDVWTSERILRKSIDDLGFSIK